jgi:hypothetical protein
VSEPPGLEHVGDWAEAAAEEIACDTSCCDISSSDPWRMAEIIRRHSPLSPASPALDCGCRLVLCQRHQEAETVSREAEQG